MKLRPLCLLAGLFLMPLTGAAVAKTSGCGCQHNVHHAAPRISAHHVAARHTSHASHVVMDRHEARRVMVRHERTRVTHDYADRQYAQSYYDYRSSSTVIETMQRDTPRHGRGRMERDGAGSRFYGEATHASHGQSEQQVELDSRDFSGGVGYGTDGGAGYGYSYGRIYSRSGMNGASVSHYGYDGNAAAMAHVRMNAWHGYNSRGGAGNGY